MGLSGLEIDSRSFRAKRFFRVIFNTLAEAAACFRHALVLFTKAKCAGSASRNLPPALSPPVPGLWKGPVQDAGFWPSELAGLVVWECALSLKEALVSVVGKLTVRLKCSEPELCLFIDTQIV